METEGRVEMYLPDFKFYLFGMGNRRKILYKKGMLLDALTGGKVRKWDLKAETICAPEYTVTLKTLKAEKVIIREDEEAVWIEEDGEVTCLTRGHLKLPTFEGATYPPLLRVLHHEILINIVDGKPLPNFFVYQRPWYRDGAMMCMCLEKTGNLHLVKDWILGLREPFDRNNAGDCEPDNFGQALYMISLVSDASHQLVKAILQTIPWFKKGKYIVGLTDHRERPVYQTKWLKFGLRQLGLDDPFEIPKVFDEYSALFWMDHKEAHVDGPPFDEKAKELYPYLGWAEAHFHKWPPPVTYSEDQYPMTWEAHASQANYEGMALISQEYVDRRICAPHAWHAAEMFLYFLDEQQTLSNGQGSII